MPGPPAGAQPLVRLRGIVKRYDKPVLNGIDLDIAAGEITALIGRSGCGKTTLLHVLAGLVEAQAGRVEPPQICKESAVVFQDHRLLPWASLADNLGLALRPRKDLAQAEKSARVGAMLAALGLADHAGALPEQLSGGMAQRAALGRALLQEPALLLMDEPFASLDALTRSDMHDLLLAIHGKRRTTILFVTHDLEEACRLADRVLVMEAGAIVADLPVGLRQPRDLDGAELRSLRRGLRQRILGCRQAAPPSPTSPPFPAFPAPKNGAPNAC